MGWTFMEKPEDVKQHLRSLLTWETEDKRNTCLDIAMQLNVAYAAVETINKEEKTREVWAAVFLMKYTREADYNWGHKDMTEHMGPNIATCPERILDLLSATDDEEALDWRRRCREALKRRMPAIGTRVRFERPIRFTDGSEEDTFRVVRMGRRKKRLRNDKGQLFQLSRRIWLEREWCVIEDEEAAA